MTLVDEAIAAERRLLDPTVRADPAAVDRLLAPDFSEIGQAGRSWSRDATLHALAAAPAILPEATAFSGRFVGPELVLVSYETRDAALRVRRTSLWRHSDDGWQVVFHQGTRVVSG